MKSALIKLGIFKNKHIPDIYLHSSLENRLELLAGLIDTDGHYDKGSSGYEITQKNKKLAHQISWLARSVGCHSTIKEVSKTCVNNGVSGQYWRVTIGRNVGNIPVRIERKKRPLSLDNQRTNLHFGIKSCEPIGIDDYYGFVLDGDSQFLGGDFTVLHNTGKTKSLSIIALWHLLCHPHSVMLVTANDMDQLKATLWKEIGISVEKIRQGPFSWLAEHVFIGADLHCHVVGFSDTWFVESKTANAKTANKMAGRHGEWFMIVVDEGSTVPDEVFATLTGALTEEHNRMLVTSQYTRLSGFFNRTQTELCKDNGGEWDAMTFSSIDSIWVSDPSLKELYDTFDDDERRVRIFGLPPEDSAKFMMNLKVANSMYNQGRIIRDDEPYGWAVSSDVALGEGLRDKSSILVGRVIGYGDTGLNPRRVEIVEIPLFSNNIRSNSLAGYILECGESLSNATTIVDKGGIGGSVCQDLSDKGTALIPVIWGKPCWKKTNSERFINQRAQATYSATRAAKEGRLSILCLDHKRHVVAQASGIPKDHSANFRLKIPEKGSAAWEGRGSPDLWDAICFFFLENVEYMVADSTGMSGTVAASAVAEAEDMFADVD